MAMFGRYEDWGLQAIVGASNNIEKMENNINGQCALGIWGLPQDDQNFILGFSDLIGKTSSSMGWGDGLETLYKPFYPVQNSNFTEIGSSIISPISSFSSTPKEVKYEVQEDQLKQGTDYQEVIKPKGSSQILEQTSSSVVSTSYSSPRFKKRKNQQKRVVTQVKAEDYLTIDMWAWRKYGQKPIKGSPYPRSYYRCSSMKGCQARKQVEQSCPDPDIYIVTYTAEHCHTQPTRRNSLAGTVRNKFPTTPKNPITAVSGGNNTPPQEISSKSPPLNESSEELIRTMEWGINSNGDQFSISDFLMNDDFFSSLEDLDGPVL